MIKLSGKLKPLNGLRPLTKLLICTLLDKLPDDEAEGKALLCDQAKIVGKYGAVLRKQAIDKLQDIPEFLLPEDMQHLSEGDVIRISEDGHSVRVLFRAKSNHNAILLTEQCNHYCLMCSQPPKDIDDSWLLDEAKQLVQLLPTTTKEIGFTGGEPTLYGDGFIDLLRLTNLYLPNTAVHILSNGRSFKDIEFARKYAAVGHKDVMLGIPIYSDDPVRHDYIVQAEGAFSETIAGILNLKALRQRVEIRVVLHKQSVPRLVQTAEFIARNLLFVDHVALMGLEVIGFTRANLDDLWIDQFEYKDKLSEAVDILEAAGLNLSIYNHQLCLVNADVSNAYRRSISDWKNEYVDECKNCTKQYECGGFFTSSKQFRYSSNISAFKN